MKKNRNVYHYNLRGLTKLRQSKIKLSVSRSMMTSKNRNYYKSTRAVRKNRYNNTPVVDGIHGNSEITNVFKSKFSVPYISVSTTTEAMESVFATTVQIMRMKQMVIHIVMLLKEIMLNQPLTS